MAAYPRVSYGMPIFRIKEGDTQPPIEYQCVDEYQVMVPIIGATQVQFRYRLRTALPATAVTRVATIVDAQNGQVRYDMIVGDTTVPGEYYGEWIVTFPSAQQRTFPVRGFQPYVVEADLD